MKSVSPLSTPLLSSLPLSVYSSWIIFECRQQSHHWKTELGLFQLFSRDPSNTFAVSSSWSLTCGQTRSGGTNLNFNLFFNADLNVILKTEKCQRFFSANLLSEFKSNPRSDHSFSKVSVICLQYFCW